MDGYHLTEQAVREFILHMERGEYAGRSIEKYRRDIQRFYTWLGDDRVREGSAAA